MWAVTLWDEHGPIERVVCGEADLLASWQHVLGRCQCLVDRGGRGLRVTVAHVSGDDTVPVPLVVRAEAARLVRRMEVANGA